MSEDQDCGSRMLERSVSESGGRVVAFSRAGKEGRRFEVDAPGVGVS